MKPLLATNLKKDSYCQYRPKQLLSIFFINKLYLYRIIFFPDIKQLILVDIILFFTNLIYYWWFGFILIVLYYCIELL